MRPRRPPCPPSARPFPEKRIVELSRRIKGFVVPEVNFGQMAIEIERVTGGRCPTGLLPHAGGTAHASETILDDHGGCAMSEQRENPDKLLRMDRMPSIWCPGCGIGTTVNCFTRVPTHCGQDRGGES